MLVRLYFEGGEIIPISEEQQPTLYSNCTEEDFEAAKLLKEAGIKFQTRGPLLGEKTPRIFWPECPYRDYYIGIGGVEEFIEDYRKRLSVSHPQP